MYRGKVVIAGMDTSALPVMQEEEKMRLLRQMPRKLLLQIIE